MVAHLTSGFFMIHLARPESWQFSFPKMATGCEQIIK